MPSLTHFGGNGNGSGWFVLTDPSPGRRRRRRRSLPSIGLRTIVVGILGLGSVLGSALWAASHAGSLLGGLLLALLGGSIGALVGGMLAVIFSHLPGPRIRGDRDDGSPRLVVRPVDERAWRLCQIGAALAESRSWADRTVDPTRRAPEILWSAVGRSLVVDRQYADAQRAAAHASLADLAQDTLARVAGERASLEAIEANLRAVLVAATGIDQRRAQLAADWRSAHERQREEQQLRARLTGQQAGRGNPVESHLQADSSAGLAAEAQVISELLAESDAMLRDMD